MSDTTLVRQYLKFFIGTVIVWVVMLLGTAILLAGTPSAPTELVFVICAGAIVSILWGSAWFLALMHEKSAAAHGAGPAATQVERATDGAEVTTATGSTGALGQAPILFLGGTLLIWVALIIATALTIRDTAHLIEEMLLILGAGAVWSIMVVPSILAASAAPRMTSSGPAA